VCHIQWLTAHGGSAIYGASMVMIIMIRALARLQGGREAARGALAGRGEPGDGTKEAAEEELDQQRRRRRRRRRLSMMWISPTGVHQ
jgi:hypothetical protein